MPTFPGTLIGGYTRVSGGGLDPYGGTGTWNNHPTNFEVGSWLGYGWDGANGESVSPAPCSPTETAYTVSFAADRPTSEVTTTLAQSYPSTWISGTNFTNVWITTTTDGPSNYVFRYGNSRGPVPASAPTHTKIGVRQWRFTIPSASAADSNYPGGPFTYEFTIDGSTQSATPGTPIDHTFASGGWKTVYYKVTNTYGLWTIYALYFRVNQEPIASFTWSEVGAGSYPVTFDGSGSSDPDAYPTTPLVYSWDFGDGSGTTFGVGPVHDYDEDGDYTVVLTVNDGADTDTDTQTVTVTAQRTDSADLPSRAVYVFYKSGADLKLAFYPNGSASRSVVATFTGCKSPSIYVKPDSSLVAGMDNGTNFVLKRSTDRGATWSDMATIFSSATYHKAAVTNLLNGGAAAVAVKRGTSPVEVYSLVTPNDADWSGATPVLVDTTASTSTQFTILQKQASGSIRLVISNGIDELWQSDNSGVSWTAV